MSSPIPTTGLPSEALGMGSPTAEFRAAAGRSWRMGITLGLLGLGIGALAIMAARDGENGASFGMGFGVLMLGLGLWQVYTAIHNRDLRIVVLEKGLVRVGGGRTQVARWDDIASVFQAITVTRASTAHVYTVWLNDNTRIVFNDTVNNVKALGDTIQQEAAKRLLPKYQETLDAGGTVTFGKLTLSKAGIDNGKETIPWDQVDAVNINRGQISVLKQGKTLGWAGQRAAATPNVLVFLTLIDRFKGSK